MKIAFIMGYFPALSTTFINNQITGLLAAGHEVEVFALRRPDEKKIHPDIIRYKLLERVTYFEIPRGRIRRAFKAGHLLIKNFRRGPSRLLKSLNFYKYGKEALALNLFYYLVPFVGKKFDILHAHSGPLGMIGWWLRELGVDGRLITTFYGADLSSFIKANGVAFYLPIFADSDRLLPICQYFRKKLLAWGCPEDKIIVHPVGIDLETFMFSQRQRKPDHIFRILTIARLIEKKGIAYALHAVAILACQYDQIEYTVAGYGPLNDSLQSLARKLQISSQVKFVGAVDRDEQLRLFAQNDLFLLPSVTADDNEEEGTPTVLLEAQAAGLPVISTWHSGIPEIVQDKKTGFLVAERDVQGLVEKIACLIVNPGIARDLGVEGRNFMEKNFDIKKLNRRLEKIYQDLLQA
jgi:colanic acid/amylovoran/stewartan biosynthesis glycosyltransferase WcaL/AmsK/CpsK